MQLINATTFSEPMKRSLGNKRKQIADAHIAEIERIYTEFKEGEYSKIFDNDYFGYFQVTVEQPQYTNSSKRDRENIPLSEDIEMYFEKEIKPFVPDAWIDYEKTRIGYEINFTKYFYKYQKLRNLADIKADIRALEQESEGLLEKILS